MSSRWFRGESCACLFLECVEPSPKNPSTQQTDAVRWHDDTMLTPSVSHSPTMNISSSMSLRTRRRWDSKTTPGRNQRKIDNNWRHITDASFGFDIWRNVITVQIYRKIYTWIDLNWTQSSSSVNVSDFFFIVIMTYITVILRGLCKETVTPLLFTVFNKLQTSRVMWTIKLDMLI